MEWLHDISYFFGGAFLINALPHLINGVSGHPFQTLFATHPGEGLSSSTVNVLWAFFNLLVAYLLLCKVGNFSLYTAEQAASAGLGMLLCAVMTARLFGRFHGGNHPGNA